MIYLIVDTIIMKAQNITNIFYALLGMGILVYALNHFASA
jgi:hypothetical protein